MNASLNYWILTGLHCTFQILFQIDFGKDFMRNPICFFILLLAILWSPTCDIDRGLSPHLGKITGDIIFLNKSNDVIDKTDEIRVAVAKSFPPTEFTELITSPLNKRAGDTLHYEMIVPFGTYQLLGVVWKGKQTPWNLSDIIGYYRRGLDFLPTPVTVTLENPLVESIDLTVDFSQVIREARITGTIHYDGEWPGDTQVIGLGAYRNPPDPDNFFSILNASSAKIGLPIFVPSFDYNLPVSVGTFQYIGLFWKAKGTPFTEIKVLGFYADPQLPERPGSITLVKGQTLDNIDIHVDFNSLEF